MILQDGKMIAGNTIVIDKQELNYFRLKYPMVYRMVEGMIQRKEITVVPDMEKYYLMGRFHG